MASDSLALFHDPLLVVVGTLVVVVGTVVPMVRRRRCSLTRSSASATSDSRTARSLVPTRLSALHRCRWWYWRVHSHGLVNIDCYYWTTVSLFFSLTL